MESDIEIGHRLECDDAKGTILFIGEVPPTSGIWYGVDWDDTTRGRHDGTCAGVRYFEARHEKSGSFVRKTKVKFGISLEEGVRLKYQGAHSFEEDLTAQFQKSIKARFVEIVGMEKIGKQQSQLDKLEIVVLDGLPISGLGNTDLCSMLPRIQDLDISNALLPSWDAVADICRQLKVLKKLNVGGNRLPLPTDLTLLTPSFNRIVHVIMNNMVSYTWDDLLKCSSMFVYAQNVQLAFNNLTQLSPIPVGIFEVLEDLDIGANPISDFAEILHFGNLKNLKSINLNECSLTSLSFPETPPGEQTEYFPKLEGFCIANNPIEIWPMVAQLDKLKNLKELTVTHDEALKVNIFVLEHTFSRIRTLDVFNRTLASKREKRDFRLFYMRMFSDEYYTSGGSDNPEKAKLTAEFMENHPTYLHLVKLLGAPADESSQKTLKSQNIRDMKLSLKIVFPDDPESQPVDKSFMPTMRISKLKMMLKRQLKLDANTHIILSYLPKGSKNSFFEIALDNDMHNLQYFSIANGDTIYVRH